jgi:hypothetical protein
VQGTASRVRRSLKLDLDEAIARFGGAIGFSHPYALLHDFSKTSSPSSPTFYGFNKVSEASGEFASAPTPISSTQCIRIALQEQQQ